MGCQIATCLRDHRVDQDEDHETSIEPFAFLSLPNEVLVKIIMFLPESRDRVKLRYVSRKLRSISETPSLWRDFVWTDYNLCEAKYLCDIMKVCGVHIRRLSFPQKLIQPNGLHKVTRGCATVAIKLMKKSEMANMLH